jgi:predicted amidophosphoribosyltransferase
MYDDRIFQIGRRIGSSLSLPVAELLENKADREPQHATAQRRNIQALTENLQYRAASVRHTGILLIDDVLTTGATFTACKSILQANLPGVPIWGLFVARRVPEAEPEDVDYGDMPDDD